ncbi:MAG: hypothetical protein ABFE07_02410 [Armatimonadia bacterium]
MNLRQVTCCLLLSLCVGSHLYAQEKLALKYAPEAGTTWDETLTGKLCDILLQGQPLGYSGTATTKLKSEIVSRDADQQFCLVKLSCDDVTAKLNGQTTKPTPPTPVTLKVTELGCTSLTEQSKAGFNLLDTGGVPLQVIAILAHGLRFSGDPVGVGEEWACQDCYGLPGVGDVRINTRWRLMSFEDGVATIASTAAGALPNFKAPSPMGGADMDMKNGKLYITEMKQEYDVAKSRVLTTDGKVRIDAIADLAGMQVPVVLTMQFKLEQAEPAAAAEPAK